MKVLIIGHHYVVDGNRQLWSVFGQEYPVQVDLVAPLLWKSNLIKELHFKNNPITDEGIDNIFPIKVFGKGNGSFYIFNPIPLIRVFWNTKYDAVVLDQETWSFSLLQIFLIKLFSPNMKSKFFLRICQNLKKKKLYFLRFFERFNTLGLDSIFCCCSEIKDVIDWKGIKKTCKYFPFSFDLDSYKKNTMLFNEDKTVLGYMGRISEEKGISLMLDTFRELKKTNPNVELLIAGGGPLEHLLHEEEGVKFLGLIPHAEAYQFYEKIDLFLLPSQTRSFWKEQFGRVIAESVGSGKPVIGSDSGAIPEVLGNLNIPYVFKEDSKIEFLRTIKQAIEDKNSGRLLAMMESSRKLAFDWYGHKAVSDRFYKYATEDGDYGVIRND